MSVNKESINNYLDGLNEFKFDFSLERIKKVLKYLNNPQNNYKVIHITGSNGKGSVAHFFSFIFKEAGIKVGLYTSPHLLDVRERIIINNKIINKKLFYDTVLQIKNITGKLKVKLTYFEFLTVVAFVIFKKAQVKVAIIEVGLGGRLDATNVNYKNKILSIITSLDLEHTNYLGKTKKSILLEKEKIIDKSLAVCNIKEKKLKKLLLKKHKNKVVFPDDCFETIKFEQKDNFLNIIFKDLKNNDTIKIKTRMIEFIQAENIKTVLTALCILKNLFDIPFKKVKKALSKTKVLGRFTRHKKGYYLSVAHNPAAIREMIKTAETIAKKRRIVFIYSALKDKNVNNIFKIISRIKNIYVILTPINNERAISIEKLKKIIVKYNIKYKVEKNNYKALKLAKRLKKNGIIIIGGSFYLVNKFLD